MGNISIGTNEVDLRRVEKNSGTDKGLFEKKVSCFARAWCIYIGSGETKLGRWAAVMGLWDWMSA